MGADRRPPLLFLIVLAAFSAAASARLLQPGSSGGKVTVALYYETLCPYCSNFIVNYLRYLVADDQMMDIVDLKLIPYGNAKISKNGTVVCQHGKWECVLNKVEACAIDTLPSLSVQFHFIYCVENFVYKHQYTEWAQCFDEIRADPKPIMDCYNGQRGEELILQYANETGALQPPHKYVPWVTVNGEPLYDDYKNFLAYICKAYKGSDPPGTCAALSLKSPPRTGGNFELNACPREVDTASLNTKLAKASM